VVVAISGVAADISAGEVRTLVAAPASAVERGPLVAAHVSAVEAHVFILEARAFHHSARVNLK
jgi:hypothetical protein